MSIWLSNNTFLRSCRGRSSSSLGWITLVLDFLDFDGCFLRWIGLEGDFLPIFGGLVFGDNGFEDLVEVGCKGGFEELWGELDELVNSKEKIWETHTISAV